MFYGLLIIIFVILLLFHLRKNNNTTISKDDSTYLKFLCAIFIFIHHISYIVKDLNVVYTPIQYMAFPIVGLFFFLSGYGIYVSFNKDNSLKKLISRLKKIVIPFLCVEFVILMIEKITFNIPFHITIYKLALVDLISPFWYIYIYICVILLYWILNKISKKSILILLMLCLIYIIIGSIYIEGSQWFSSIIGFPFGLLYKKYEKEICRKIEHIFGNGFKSLFKLFAIFMILFLLRLVISYFITDSEIIHGLYRNLVVVAFCLFICEFMKNYSFKKDKNILIKNLQSTSYEIYLLHPIFIHYFKSVYQNSLVVILLFVLVMLSSFLFNKILSFLKIN